MEIDITRPGLCLKIERAIQHLYLLGVDARLYSDNHPKLRETVTTTIRFLQELLEGLDEIEIKEVEGVLIYDNYPLQNQLHTTRDYGKMLKERGIECLVLKKGLTQQELIEYARFMRLSEAHRKQLGDSAKHFRQRGIHHIEVHKLADMRHTGKRKAGEARGLPIAMTTLSAFRRDHFLAVKELQRKVEVAQVLDLDVAERIVRSFLKESVANSSVLAGLSSITAVDEYTASHSMNVCLLSVCMARYLGLDGPVLAQIGIACLLHDIGKMFVAPRILNKQGALDAEEWRVMQDHPVMGARFLLSIRNLPPLAAIVAFEHHMTQDGSGYPEHPNGYTINLASQLACLADFYDALTTDRPYRKAMPPAKAIEIVRCLDPNKMDQRIRDLFLDMMGPYPVGSVVQLVSGEVAVVSRHNHESPNLPELRIVRTSRGEPVIESTFVDLSGTTRQELDTRSIVRALDPEEVQVDPLDFLEEAVDRDSPASAFDYEPTWLEEALPARSDREKTPAITEASEPA